VISQVKEVEGRVDSLEVGHETLADRVGKHDVLLDKIQE